MMGFESNGCFVTNAPCLNRGNSYSFASSIGHPMSNSVGLLVYDDMRTYPGHLCCITCPSGQRQPARKRLISWVEHMELNYDVILLL
jgi:hypothetical protein